MTEEKIVPDEWVPQRALVIVAHPDDAEFGSAATIAKWTQRGCEVVYCLCTDGSSGSNDLSYNRSQLTETRHDEQRAACEVLGVREVVFLDYPDGVLEPSIALRRDLTRVIRKYRPEAVFCPNPVRTLGPYSVYVNHPDHLAAGEAGLAAIYPSACSRPIFPELLDEGLEIHKVSGIYITATETPDCWIDVTETIDKKIAALRQHKSQLGADFDVDARIREWAAERGKDKGLVYAECFKFIPLR